MKAFRVRVPPEHEDWASGLLWDQGTEGIEVQALGSEVQLLAYFPDTVAVADLEATLRGVPGLALAPAEVPEVDWVARFREHFRGFSAGPFRVAPAWDVPAGDRGRLLVVDPGRAFGTGTHETTRLCLTALASLAGARPLGRLLDVGTGTGILAIAARKLGARLTVGVDSDPESMASAARHCELNGVRLSLVRGDGATAFLPGVFDTVVANMTAPLLRERRHEILACLSPKGTLVLSGILLGEVPELRAAYGGPGSPSLLEDGDWAALVLRLEP